MVKKKLPNNENSSNEKAEIELYLQKINKKLKEDPKVAKKAALILSELLKEDKGA